MEKSLKKTLILILIGIFIGCICLQIPTYANECTGGEHSYRIEIVKKATETASGTERHTCSKCGHSYDEVIPKTGHHFGNWQTEKAATCGHEGLLMRICSVCGKKEYKTVSSAGEHKMGAWTVSSKVTCTEDGKKIRSCTKCSYYETETTLAGGHSYTITTNENENWVYTKYDCSVCGHNRTEKVPAGSDPEKTEPVVIGEEEVPSEDENKKEEEENTTGRGIILSEITIDVEKEGVNALDGVLTAVNILLAVLFSAFIISNLSVIRWDKLQRAKLAKGGI